MAHCKWPYCLCCRQWRTDVMSSAPSFSSSEADGVSSLSLMSSCWHGALYFPWQPSMPWAWRYTPLGVRDEHQVIGGEKLPWYTSAKLTRKHLQYQNKEQWAKGRTIMHPNSHIKLFTLLTIDLHSRHWSTCPGWHTQPIPQPWGSIKPIVGPSLEHHRRFSQSWRRQSRVVSWLRCTSPTAGDLVTSDLWKIYE